MKQMPKNRLINGALIGVLVISVLTGCEEREQTDVEYLSHAKELMDQRDFKGSVLELKNALGKNPDNPEARLLLGQIYIRMENGVAAEKELRHAMTLDIPLSALAIDLAQALLLQDEHQKLLDQLASDSMPDDKRRAKLIALRAIALLGLGKRAESELAVQESLALNSSEPEALLGLARLAFLKGDGKEALVRVDEALGVDKNYLPAWLLKGEIFRLRQDVAQARQAFDRAIEIDGESVRAYIGRSLIALVVEDYKQAGADADVVLQYYNNHPIATYVKGVVAYKGNKYEEALALFQRVEQDAPNFKPLALWLSSTHASLGQYVQARQYANKYLKAFPDSAEARKLVASLELQQSQPKEALAVLAALERLEVSDPQILNLLGMAHAGVGNLSKGAEYLREAVEAAPQNAQARVAYSMILQEQSSPVEAIEQMRQAIIDQPELADQQLLLIQRMIQMHQLDEAAKDLERLMKERSKDPKVLNLSGVLLMAKEKTAEAAKAFEKALQLSKGFPPAAHNLAIIALLNKDRTKARSYYMDVIEKHPDHAATLVALYSLDKVEGKSKESVLWLKKAIDKHPENPMVAALLAREYSAQGQHLKALSTTDLAAKKYSGDIGLLEARGVAQLGSGQPANALRDFNRWVEIQPNSANAHFYLAQVQAAMSSFSDARKSFEKTLMLEPSHLGASVLLAKLQLRQGDIAKPRQIAADLRRKFPLVSEGWLIESDALMISKQYPAAAQVMRELLAKGGKYVSTENTLRLARAQWAGGDRQAALDQVLSWTKSNPKDVPALLYIAESRTVLGQKKEAVEIYERLMTLAPDHPSVLNNFAWLLKDESAERALKLSDKAYKLAPQQLAVADTFGMVLLANKQSGRAVEVLAGAAKQTDNPNIQYHYALALARDGRSTEAKGIVDKLVNEPRDFSEKRAAHALLRELAGQ